MTLAIALLAAPTFFHLPQISLDGHDQDIQFTYVEAGWVRSDFDLLQDDLDGFDVALSHELPADLHVAVRGRALDDDVLGTNVEVGSLAVLLGYHREVGYGTAVVFEGGFGWLETKSAGGPTLTDDGFVARAGVRHRPNRMWEVLAAVDYENIGSDDDLALVGEVIAHVDDGIALVGRASFGDEVDTIGLGVRFGF